MFSSAFIAKALKLTPQYEHSYPYLTHDSRKVQGGCLFVCLKGERFDGHQFIAEAIQKGAKGILCEKKPDQLPKGVELFQVNDSLGAYRQVAGAWRRQFSVPLIVVAGSVGKTTTKELLAAILSGKYGQVHKTHGSQNGWIGIPMSLLDLKPDDRAAVIEVGIDDVGAMEQHLALVQATGGIVTAVGPEHMDKLGDLETVAREETLVLIQVGGTVAINLDDKWIEEAAEEVQSENSIPFSLVQRPEHGLRGTVKNHELLVSGLGWKNEAFSLPLPGRHNALNLLGAIAIAAGLQLSADEVREGLKHFKPLFGRSQIRKGTDGVTYFCDYYNSNPTSLAAALQVVRDHPTSGRRLACLGDMLELGPDAVQFHRDMAEPIQSAKLDRVWLLGPMMKNLAKALEGTKVRVEHTENLTEMIAHVRGEKKKDDIVLIKGSRGMKMETLWKELHEG